MFRAAPFWGCLGKPLARPRAKPKIPDVAAILVFRHEHAFGPAFRSLQSHCGRPLNIRICGAEVFFEHALLGISRKTFSGAAGKAQNTRCCRHFGVLA
jgi:hypothetical protein